MRLIDADAVLQKQFEADTYGDTETVVAVTDIENAPTVDAVPIEILTRWLYEIAMNNTENYLSRACEVIISRLGGLREYVKDANGERRGE